jgi:hypothetical protein
MTAKESIRDIEKLISDGGGQNDPEATRRYRRALASPQQKMPSYCVEKIDEAENWLDIYYSQRKHQKYLGGLAQIRIWILSALSVLEGHTEERD